MELAELRTLMENTEKLDEHHIGMRHQGASRARFKFFDQIYYMESRGFSARPSSVPTMYWVTDYMIDGRAEAQALADRFDAELEETPYAEEEGRWFHLRFRGDTPDDDGFDKLVRFVHTRLTDPHSLTRTQEVSP